MLYFNDSLKLELYENTDNVIKRANLASRIKQNEDVEQVEKIKEQITVFNSKKQLFGDVIA